MSASNSPLTTRRIGEGMGSLRPSSASAATAANRPMTTSISFSIGQTLGRRKRCSKHHPAGEASSIKRQHPEKVQRSFKHQAPTSREASSTKHQHPEKLQASSINIQKSFKHQVSSSNNAFTKLRTDKH